MTNKQNQIAELLNTAKAIEANTNAVDAGKSAKNAFSWQAFMILKSGFIQDKQALERLTKKGGELFNCRSYVSKAKSVLSALESGAVIEVKEQAPVSIETIAHYTFDNLPEVTLSTLYTTVKKAEKESDKNDTILEHAFLIIENKTGQTIEQVKESMPESFDALLSEAKAEAKAALDAASLDTLAQVKALIDTLNHDDINAIALYAMDKVNVSTVQAA